MSGSKRPRQDPEEAHLLNQPLSKGSPSGTSPNSVSSLNNNTSSASSSSFRNVSACNRCRLRKNRCDQSLPACSSCEKARVKCVGYDPITKREIPRAYVYYLESRVSHLEQLLSDHGIPYPPADDFEIGTRPPPDPSSYSPNPDRQTPIQSRQTHRSPEQNRNGAGRQASSWDEKREEAEKLNKLVSNVGMISVQGASDPRYLGSTSGISFARVVFAAVRSSVSSSSSDRAGIRPSKPVAEGVAATSGTSMRDSFFGLQSKPTMNKAPFPDRELGARLVNLYFEHANPQIPILHRGEFMSLFNRAYASEDRRRSPRELYMLNIVFAIGAGIILESPDAGSSLQDAKAAPIKREPSSPRTKKQKLSSHQHQAEEYHASAMVHLESFLSSTPATDRPEGFGGSLEELQAVLLLAGFALLRPVAPGLWYIVGVAMRLAVDLGLHYEDGTSVENGTDAAVKLEAAGEAWTRFGVDPRERGRREWVRDLRRRLWWCVYSFDRLVSTCVGRPFGISDQVITTEFPSLLDDNYITTSGFTAPPHAIDEPSYKRVAHHYLRLRLLQSEILQVLQYRQAQQARENGRNRTNEFMHTKLISPFLEGFDSFRSWRKDIDRRLWEWKESAPTSQETKVQFSIQFLELNYWQAVIMLYRQSLSVPPVLAGEVTPSDEIASPMSISNDEREDDDDVFLKVAEAGQSVLKLYRQLHRVHLVNYTFLATHHLFMAGIAFLYAIWHSATVRSYLTLDDVDFTVLAATSVLGDLIEKCPPAEACRDAFDRMSKATVQMCLSTTGFGSRVSSQHAKLKHTQSSNSRLQPQQVYMQAPNEQGYFRPQRPRPQLDTNLRELFPEETVETRNFSRNLERWQTPASVQTQQDILYHQLLNAGPQQYQQQQYFPNQPLPPSQQSTPTPTFTTPSYNSTSHPAEQNAIYSPAPPTSYPLPPGAGGQDNPFQTSDIDALLADSNNTTVYNGHPGFTLGFDSEHDWNDGTQLDLFDEFFFGGNGGTNFN